MAKEISRLTLRLKRSLLSSPLDLRLSLFNMIKTSKGEKEVIIALFNLNISYKREKEFVDCYNPTTNVRLRFDFWIPSLITCIEFDGEHHYRDVKAFNSKVNYVAYLDRLKNEYCKKNKINLIRIKYDDIKNISRILQGELDISKLDYSLNDKTKYKILPEGEVKIKSYETKKAKAIRARRQRQESRK